MRANLKKVLMMKLAIFSDKVTFIRFIERTKILMKTFKVTNKRSTTITTAKHNIQTILKASNSINKANPGISSCKQIRTKG